MANIDILLAPAYQAAAEVTSPNYWVQQAYSIAAQTAAAAGIEPTGFASMFVRQMQQESGLNPYVQDSSAGARGIAQLMPMHWADVDPTDPVASLHYAANMMASYMGTYGDPAKALAAYNWGPGNVNSVNYLSGDSFYSVLPSETRSYLSTILGGNQPMITPPDTGTEGDQSMGQPQPTATPAPGGNSFGFGQSGAPTKTRYQKVPPSYGYPPGTSYDPINHVYIDANGNVIDPSTMTDGTDPNAVNDLRRAQAQEALGNVGVQSGRLALDARDAAIKNSLDLINSLHQLNQIDLTRQEDEKKNILSALPYTSQGNQPFNASATPFDPSMSPGYDPLIAYHLAQLEPQIAAQPGAAAFAPPAMSSGYSGAPPPPPAGGGVPPGLGSSIADATSRGAPFSRGIQGQ